MEEHGFTSTVVGDQNQDSKNEKKKKKGPEDVLAVQGQIIQPEQPQGFNIDSLYPRQSTMSTTKLAVSISPDHHLLRIIHLNVFRGLQQNKICLWRFTSYERLEKPQIFCGIDPDLYGSSLLTLRATSTTTTTATATATATKSTQSKDKKDDYSMLPDTLVPTETQRSRIHQRWINTFPFPRMRENLIQWEKHFDHMEFACDVIGIYTGNKKKRLQSLAGRSPGFGSGSGSGAVAVADTGSDLVDVDSLRGLPGGPTLQGDGTLDDELTTDRRGLILWGEPHRAESWEATPGFLRKWMWTIEGCDELIESTNRWRRVRGEEPIRIQRWRSETGFA